MNNQTKQDLYDIDQEDWSVEREDFKMCENALLENHKSFYDLLKKLIKNKFITKTELDEWTIFDLYKEKSEFKYIYKTNK